MMGFDEMCKAIRDAENQLNVADGIAEKLARLLAGRLRKVGSGYLLARLKLELRDFNAHTKTWKEPS